MLAATIDVKALLLYWLNGVGFIRRSSLLAVNDHYDHAHADTEAMS